MEGRMVTDASGLHLMPELRTAQGCYGWTVGDGHWARPKIALLTDAACASVDRATVISPRVIPTEEATCAISSHAKH